ncbi:uroporphyrinogen decarboxylase [Simkania negevensis]|uniref:Uroporphyrinogen decarboxylase n=1 Tax=Simkania negevensis TaxID=83561 RepID=A0ABS3ASK4_9BACT|nr:uroporphyrinogen decarboxylase [Simkania negevensis]
MTKFLQALKGCNSGKPPVWLMRQAGRYLPEYRKIRQKHRLIEMFHSPEIVAHVTLQPIVRFGLDAAILFADILLLLEGFGVSVDYIEGKGPSLSSSPKTPAELSALTASFDLDALEYVQEAVKLTLQAVDVPLIGFCGGPFTVASYLIEGGANKDLAKTMRWLYRAPDEMKALLDTIAEATVAYLKMQEAAGVHAIQIFDTWAGMLSWSAFKEYCLPYYKQITSQLQCPVILFCKGSSLLYPLMVQAGPEAISIDWQGNLAQIRKELPSTIALQGNLSPYALFGTPEVLVNETKEILAAMKDDPAFIFGLGHGILPDTPLDNVQRLVDTVKE